MRAVLDEQPDVHRREPVHVFRWIDGIEHHLLRVGPHSHGQRRLHENPVVAVVLVEAPNGRERLVQRRGRGHANQVGATAHLPRGLQLGGHVDFGPRVVAREHDAQSRRATGARREFRDTRAQLFADLVGYRGAIEKTSRHEVPRKD